MHDELNERAGSITTRARVRRVREAYKLSPDILQHNRCWTACADGQMRDELHDSAAQAEKGTPARHVEQPHTMDEMRASYKRSTRLVDVQSPPVDRALCLLV